MHHGPLGFQRLGLKAHAQQLARNPAAYAPCIVAIASGRRQAMGNAMNFDGAKAVFRSHGGVLRTRDVLKYGIHPRILYAMREAGIVERLSRGAYRLADLPPLSNQDLVTVSLRVPNGVVAYRRLLAASDTLHYLRGMHAEKCHSSPPVPAAQAPIPESGASASQVRVRGRWPGAGKLSEGMPAGETDVPPSRQKEKEGQNLALCDRLC
jgi:hypothetical protein